MSDPFDEEMQERLQQAFLRLTPMQRAVHLMAARDRLSYFEIMRRLSVPMSEVERLRTEALAALHHAVYGERDREDRS